MVMGQQTKCGCNSLLSSLPDHEYLEVWLSKNPDYIQELISKLTDISEDARYSKIDSVNGVLVYGGVEYLKTLIEWPDDCSNIFHRPFDNGKYAIINVATGDIIKWVDKNQEAKLKKYVTLPVTKSMWET